jgi:hypothetical protein
MYTFTWPSGESQTGKHTARATIAPVLREYTTWDNALNTTFLLTFKGDTNRNGKVSIEDLTYVAMRFGSSTGSQNYSSEADLNHDGRVNIFDVIICSSEFGEFIS